MSVSLSKGGNINLSKNHPALKNIIVGLGWDVKRTDGASYDLDASLFMINLAGKVRTDEDFIFYNQRDSTCKSIHHTGDNKTGDGDGDDETIHVFLDKVPETIEKLIVCVTIHDAEKKKQNFGQVENAFIRIVSKDTNEEIAKFDLSEDASVETAMIFGEIYRSYGDWKFRAVGQGYAGGLGPLARSFGVDV